MKIIIFAGGTGRRLWPISRKHAPKQFEPILGDKSTLQLAVDRVQALFGAENIYVSTNERYQEIIRDQLPMLPAENVIGEPERRDLAPAVGLAMAHLGHNAKDPDEPVAILWGDNYMNDTDTFLALLDAASEILQEGAAQIVFIGETPRFANENLGWIGLGDAVGQASGRTYYAFRTWNYRPPLPRAEEMYASGKYVWNTGYFVTTIGFVQSLYEQHQPEMWEKLDQIENAIGTNDYNTALHRLYPTMEVISFDDAILSYVAADQAVVLHGEMGWSDPGTLYALKEALAPDENENLEWGLVRSLDTRDSLLVNEEEGKLMAVIGLEGIIVVNTDDALLVVHKDDIADVKQFVNSLQETNLEKYT